MKRIRIDCHPSFKKKVKLQSINTGKTIIEVTKELADEVQLENWERVKAKKNEKRFTFRF